MNAVKRVRNLHLATLLCLKGYKYELKIDRNWAVFHFEITDELKKTCNDYQSNQISVKLLEFKERYDTLVNEVRDLKYEQL